MTYFDRQNCLNILLDVRIYVHCTVEQKEIKANLSGVLLLSCVLSEFLLLVGYEEDGEMAEHLEN